MLTIQEKQFIKLQELKFQDFANTCCDLIRNEHTNLWFTKPESFWKPFVLDMLKLARSFEIFESNNLFIFVLLSATYRYLFGESMPDWVREILQWPGRTENDKIFLLCKEIFIKNQEVKS
jgi:hypothetical protein